ncbi:ROK family protein [Cryobacterium sp. TMT1-62]|uniref:ROK family protein n=1 Tax=unclassified Cryobacterium TaxID=2649013 RepID=UPI00106B4A71|nr:MULTISPECIES: ROK family protein [unclassified Cryobacterium]TFB58313.1 ROK family protein [Cryobacterium sp. Sr3]TFC39093.1 ROK family protein [Cryobacterium sp. TMT2-14]TFD31115.1 ROK family protein [Cryobacterium sp. TMT1-62]
MPNSLALAIDIGGTKIETALVDDDGHIVAQSRHRVPTGRDMDSHGLGLALEGCVMASTAKSGGTVIVGVGIGSAGPVDLAAGMILPKNLPLLRGFPVRSFVEDLVPDRPVELRLDGTCLALAEHWIGATRGTSSSMSIVVSTGVGGGIMLDGRIVFGRSGNAGHIGQIHLDRSDDGTSDGGTLEGIASGLRSVDWARRHGWSGQTGEDLGRSAGAGDAIAIAAVQRSAAAVGRAIANVATLLDLEAVAIGGGFSHVSPSYLDIVRGSARDHAVFDYSRDVAILSSGLGSDGPLIGAAALIHRPHLIGHPGEVTLASTL